MTGSLCDYVSRRQRGFPPSCTSLDSSLWPSVYSRVAVCSKWSAGPHVGSIFGLTFTNDGHTLMCATESGHVCLLDALRCKPNSSTSMINNAHDEAVNLIKIFDDNLFATASDDLLVKLWDRRRGCKEVAQFSGHTNWVKNIEFDGRNMITSAFDETVLRWDVHNPSTPPQPLIRWPNLMRMRMTADRRTMVLSNEDGRLLVVRGVDLDTITEDLEEMATAVKCSKKKGRNVWSMRRRLPKDCDDMCISGLTPHPSLDMCISGLTPHPSLDICATRGGDTTVDREWTCVHDVSTDSGVSLITAAEPRVGRGYIKEQCWTRNGRLLVSPYAHGIRLLAFDDQCSSFGRLPSRRSARKRDSDGEVVSVEHEMHELSTILGGHSDVVLCTAASPVHEAVLASGCLGGGVAVCQPRG